MRWGGVPIDTYSLTKLYFRYKLKYSWQTKILVDAVGNLSFHTSMKSSSWMIVSQGCKFKQIYFIGFTFEINTSNIIQEWQDTIFTWRILKKIERILTFLLLYLCDVFTLNPISICMSNMKIKRVWETSWWKILFKWIMVQRVITCRS